MNATGNSSLSRGEYDYRRNKRSAREMILQILYQCDTTDSWVWSERMEEEFRRQVHEIEELDHWESTKKIRKFIDEILTGICQERNNLDLAVSRVTSHWSLGRMSAVDRNILRLAVYEIKHREDIPPLASINEAVELAKKFGDKDSPRFVNGILDRFLKEQV